MNFNLSDEQKQLADAVRRFVEKDYGFEDRKKNYESAAGYGESAWGSVGDQCRAHGTHYPTTASADRHSCQSVALTSL